MGCEGTFWEMWPKTSVGPMCTVQRRLQGIINPPQQHASLISGLSLRITGEGWGESDKIIGNDVSLRQVTFWIHQPIEKLGDFLASFIIFLLHVLEFCITTVGDLSLVGQEKQQLQGMCYG